MNAQTNHGRLFVIAHVGHLLANAAQTSRTHVSCADHRLNCITWAHGDPTVIRYSRTVNLQLLRTIFLTLAIISSFLDVDGRPEKGSFSKEVLPYLNRWNQSNTRVRPIASSPYAFCNNWYVSVAGFPISSENWILNNLRCCHSTVKQTHTHTNNFMYVCPCIVVYA